MSSRRTDRQINIGVEIIKVLNTESYLPSSCWFHYISRYKYPYIVEADRQKAQFETMKRKLDNTSKELKTAQAMIETLKGQNSEKADRIAKFVPVLLPYFHVVAVD